jgi:DNA repair exonuclease SbcCD nuclease subunit
VIPTFGCRNDNRIIAEHQAKFFNEVFFPYLKKNNIQTVIQLGDLVDRRKYINYHTLHNMKQNLFSPLQTEDGFIEFHGFPGNHDIAQKESVKINSLDQLFSVPGIPSQQHIFWYQEPQTIKIGGIDILVLPWICEENQAKAFEQIKKTKAKICLGHLEIIGFDMYGGTIAETGLNQSIFSKFDLVISGHFHSAQRKGNILYTGTPYEMAWSDWNDPKGFWILDTETLDIEMIPNPYTLHSKIFYNDLRPDFKKWINQPFTDVKDKFVKIIVEQRNNVKTFNKFVEKIEMKGALSVHIVELPLNMKIAEDSKLENIQQVDMFDIIVSVVKQNNVPNQDRVVELMKELYDEATHTS